jgi:hypothetical protein
MPAVDLVEVDDVGDLKPRMPKEASPHRKHKIPDAGGNRELSDSPLEAALEMASSWELTKKLIVLYPLADEHPGADTELEKTAMQPVART